MKRNALALLMLLVSLLGFMDAMYLTIEHYRGVVPPCSIVRGCEVVTTSTYSTIFGISVALLGSLFYLAVFLLIVAYLESQNKKFITLAAVITPLGFLVSAVFVYLQLYVIHAICIYCLGSALSSTILFILGMVELNLKTTWRERMRELWWWKK